MYPKGSPVITAAGDIPLLRQVRDSKFVSRQQLFDFLHYEGHISCRQTFKWRLVRLVKSGHIRVLEGLNWQGSLIYSIARNGLMELESCGEFSMTLNSRTRHMPQRIEVFHALELNNIRLALTRSSLLAGWQSDIEVSSRNLADGTYQKDYDAVVRVRRGDREQEFALEYERTLKSSRRYDDIRAALELEQRVPVILYLCVGADLMLALVYRLTPLAKPVAFATARAFRENLLATAVMTGCEGGLQSLDTFLENSSPPSAKGGILA